MFIKYGKEQHLSKLMEGGEIYFNPCKYFRDIEEKELLKGIGDVNDGAIANYYTRGTLTFKGTTTPIPIRGNCHMSVLPEPCLEVPMFCIKQAENSTLTASERNELKKQFPAHIILFNRT